MQSENFDERTIKIVITDSGLGGISVVAELESLLERKKIYSTVDIVFFNAVNSKSYGYNDMDNIQEQAVVFDKVLRSIVLNHTPDIILIACNTLSIVYPYTVFSKQTTTRVDGIIEAGSVYFFKNLMEEKNSSIVLLGTPTTVKSNKHKETLVNRGIKEKRIIYQACPMLESEIQNDPNSEIVLKMIEDFVGEAVKQISHGEDKIFAGLCCTHYGYCTEIFENVLKKKLGNNIEILNPNNRMVNSVLSSKKSFDSTTINIEVVSKVEILQREQHALAKILNSIAPRTVKALENYKMKSDLF